MKVPLFIALALLTGGAGCDKGTGGVAVYTSVDQVFSDPILRSFEEASRLQVRALFDTEETKSTGVLNRLISEADRPQADVFWSGDPVRPFLLIRRGLVESYVSPSARRIPPAFRAEDGSWTGFAARARVLLVNRKLLGDSAPPRSIRDLADPRWKGKGAMANPLFGTTTMHVAALFSLWGEEKGKGFLRDLKANETRLVSSNGEVKRLVASGELTFGLTDTDDAAEAIRSGAPVETVYPDQDGLGTLLMPTVVVLIRGGPHPEAGRRLVDHLLSEEAERRMAETAGHMPLGHGVTTPQGVKRTEEIRVMEVNYQEVAAQMEKIQPWLRDWVGL